MIKQKKTDEKILSAITRIQNKFPELYEHLDETPLSPFYDEDKIHQDDFEQYLETLNMQLATFEKNHARTKCMNVASDKYKKAK